MKNPLQWLRGGAKSAERKRKGPSHQELSETLARLIYDWSRLPAEPAGLPAEGPVEMSLEFKVKLEGEEPLLLVLRASQELAGDLSEAAAGHGGARSLGEFALRDLCSRLASRLVVHSLKKKLSDFQGHLPKPTHAREWPLRDPDSACVLLVEHRALEARLWLGDLGGHGFVFGNG